MSAVDVVQLLADEVARSGMTLTEAKQRAAVERVALGLGLAGVSSADHRLVRDRLKRATVRAAGSRTSCRRCGSPIRFVLTGAHDREMPIDPLPHATGNVVLHRVPGLVRPRAEVLGEVLESSPWPRYRPHFATCPEQQRVPVGPTSAEEAEVAAERAAHPLIIQLTIRSTTWCTFRDCEWKHTGPASDAKKAGRSGAGYTVSEAKAMEHYQEQHMGKDPRA